MASAGQLLVAGRIPGERINTDVAAANSDDVDDTETEVQTVTADVVSGRTYKITWDGALDTSAADQVAALHIREDDVSGTIIQGRFWPLPSTLGQGFHIEGEFTASSTGSKTFSATLARSSGSGTVTLTGASASGPTYLYVDYIRE